MSHNVLVVAAHPDDEALGCGGTMAKHAENGDTVHALFLTHGVGARLNEAKSQHHIRISASKVALAHLGTANSTYYDLPDNQLDTVPMLTIVRMIEDIAQIVKPEIVYTHHNSDLNIDHRICNQAVITAFRPIPGQHVSAIYAFEVCSSTNWAFGSAINSFQPNRYINITKQWAAKQLALEAYALEMRDFPHGRSLEAVEALARWRGTTVGVSAAEAFTVIREVL